jgi:acyl carrier protein
MSDPTEDKVFEILARIARTKKPITLSTSVNHDLPIDGDDAAELIDSIWREFKTNFENFKFDQYFNEEGAGSFFSFGKKKKKSLVVQHLVDVIKQGFWSE